MDQPLPSPDALPVSARNALAHLLIEALRVPTERATLEAAVAIATLGAGTRLTDEGRAPAAARGRACVALCAAGLLRTAAPATPIAALEGSRSAPRPGTGSGSTPAPASFERCDPAWGAAARRRLALYALVLPRTTSGTDLPTALTQSRELFAAQLDFEVHEVLEPLWMAAHGADRSLLQGIIQAAVAWAHWQTGNRTGASTLAREAAAKLARDGRRTWHGFAVAEVARAADAWATWLAAGSAGEPPPRPFAGASAAGDPAA